jgi:cohesin complex subunit SCC1
MVYPYINNAGTERKVRKKRKLVIDEQKAISSETMKIQLSDTSEIVTTLDLAPPTKKLMHWKETGGVEKLFAFSGRQMISKRLAKVNILHLLHLGLVAETAGLR